MCILWIWGLGFENKGTEALSLQQVSGCFFFRLATSQRIKGCLWRLWYEMGSWQVQWEYLGFFIEEGAFWGYYMYYFIPINKL